MKLVNADYGIDAVPAEENKRKWYRHHKLPLLPMFEYRPRDIHNEAHFTFSWLLLRAHSLMAPQFSIEFKVDEHGIRFHGSLPYVSLTLWLIPFPEALWRFSYNHFWRLPQRMRDD